MTEKLAEESLSGIKEKMAGEVVLSTHPGRTLRKWRKDFEVSQTELAKFMKTVPSVVADYEADRRASPGAHFIRRYVEALVAVDMDRGGRIVKQFAPPHLAEGILGIREFSVAVPLKLFSEIIEASRVSNIDIQRDIHGYTLVDAPRAILSLGAHEFVQIYGWTTQRALIFTGMKYGRSPMVAIRAHLLKPAAVVYSGTRKVDPLAVRLSEVENIPLLITPLGPNEIMKRLEEM
jgi:putative transcriptional regulator